MVWKSTMVLRMGMRMKRKDSRDVMATRKWREANAVIVQESGRAAV